MKRAALFGLCSMIGVSSVSVRALARCENPEHLEEYSGSWFLAKTCEITSNAGQNLVTGMVTNLGKAAVGAAFGAVSPALSSLLGLGGTDPFAKHADRIINEINLAISQSQQEIIGAVSAGVDDLYWAMVMQRQLEVDADFAATRARWKNWNVNSSSVKMDSYRTMENVWSDLAAVRADIRGMLLSPNEILGSSVLKYPNLTFLHQYITVSSLTLEANAQYTLWSNAANGELQSEFERALRERAELDLGDNFGAFMTEMSALNPFLANLNSMYPLDERSWEGGLQNPDDWRYAGSVRVEYRGQPHLMDVHYVNDRFCASKAVPTEVYLDAYDASYPALPFPVDICPGSPSPNEFGDPGILRAIRLSYRDLLLRSDEYYDVLVAGYGPLRVALDAWWERLVEMGTRNGDRPYFGLDRELDRVLWSRADFGGWFDAFLQTTATPNLGERQRSVLVGFALEHGLGELLSLAQSAWTYDRLGSAPYPVEVHRAYVKKRDHSEIRARDYYQGQFAAKFIALM